MGRPKNVWGDSVIFKEESTLKMLVIRKEAIVDQGACIDGFDE